MSVAFATFFALLATGSAGAFVVAGLEALRAARDRAWTWAIEFGWLAAVAACIFLVNATFAMSLLGWRV